MCGSFTCSKNTLVGLNVIYILVSFLIIGVAVHSKVTGIVTDLPIIGGITASGVFLLFISVVGLIGAVRHHQVLLFFYMVILFLIFIIQFSCSCAALSVNDNDQKHIVYNGWQAASTSAKQLIVAAEEKFDCCGSGITEDPKGSGNYTTYLHPSETDHKWSVDNHVVFKEKCVNHTATDCYTCFTSIDGKVDTGFRTAGGLGLFFSFPEVFGAIVACRYRNMMDPFAASTPSFVS